MNPKIGWSKKEMIWLEAALTLPAIDFFLACEDIASMSDRTVAAVAQKAKLIQRHKQEKPQNTGRELVLTPFRYPTKQQLMGCHARVARAG